MTIFLSASVPDRKRHEKYHATADVVAIRDAVRALVTVVLPQARLVWGGHPAITPLIRIVAQDLGITDADQVRLYQSAFFRDTMPADNAAFESVTIVSRVKANQEASLERMRQEMISSERFSAGVFIGGMEGVEIEYRMFCRMHPSAKALPVASTGAAALHIFDEEPGRFPQELKYDYAYPSLFRRLLSISSTDPG
jgi:hypothetical protein